MKNSIRSSSCALLLMGVVVGCRPDGGVTDPGTLPGAVDASLNSVRFSNWSAPVNLGPVVNSPFVDFTPEISADGLSLYFSSDRPNGRSPAPDLWVSRRPTVQTPWRKPRNLGSIINTAGNEGAPHLSADGHQLFFTSDRPGSLDGSNDVWVSTRKNIHNDFGWGEPVNLGSGVNSNGFEAGASLRRPEFYFTSDRGPAPLDIYVSRVRGPRFGPGVLVAELSSEGNDLRPSIRFDGKEILLSSDRAGAFDGSQDLWVSSRRRRDDAWSTPTNLGPVINSAAQELQPALSDDATQLYFASDRVGSADLDLWVTTRARQPKK